MRTLLIADDERTIREGIASATDWGSLGISRVLQASNGKKAFQIIGAEKPDIVIVDILMPEMTGIELIAQCRKSAECPEFVIISGHDEFKYAQEALKNHVYNYILKPCDTVEIADTAKKILQELDARRSMEEDRKELRERLDVLMPQARERLFHDFLSGAETDTGRLRVLRESLGAETERFQLLLLFAGEPEKQRELPALKSLVDAEQGLGDRCLSSIIRDSLIVLIAPDKRGAAERMVERLRGQADGRGLAGLQAAVSAPGGFDALPQLHLVTHRTVERAFLMKGSEGTASLLEASSSPYSSTVQKAMRHIEEHFADSSLTLGKTAKDILHMNGDYAGKLFKKECGLTFGEYLMAVRVERAKRIMAASDDVRIYEAAWQVGFGDDAAYFSQVFRKYTGLSPGEYRKSRGVYT